MFGCMLALMKDRFGPKTPKPSDLVDISEVWEGPQRGTGRRGAVPWQKGNGNQEPHTHT